MLPTPEMVAKRMALLGRFDQSERGLDPSLPIDVLFAQGSLRRFPSEDEAAVERRRDAGADFGSLAWRIWGQPFAGIDAASRRLVPPSQGADDGDHRRARQADARAPDRRADDERCRFEAMLEIAGRRPDRAEVLVALAAHCRPLDELEPWAPRRKRYLGLLLDALDLISDRGEVARAMTSVRAKWSLRGSAAAAACRPAA